MKGAPGDPSAGGEPDPASADLRTHDVVVDGGDFELTVGVGKLVLWLGRKVEESAIETLLRAVAEADARAGPREPLLLTCRQEEIPRYLKEGLELLGYALPADRALFRVPFADSRAVAFYARHLADLRARGDVQETLLWRSSPSRLRRLLSGLHLLSAEIRARPRSRG